MIVRKSKIRYKRVVIFLIILLVFVLIFLKIFSLNISNIYISGNSYLSDQDIIEMAKLENYPSAIMTFSNVIKNNIISNSYVESVSVKKKNITEVYITVVENRPLFYDDINHRTVLKNGEYTSDLFNIPILTSNISGSIYDDFLKKFALINLDVFNVISEVSYDPNDVDKELFLFTMNDGNYIYVNLDKFENVNRYFEMVVKFDNHKGILYLDSGEYFKILDN